MKLKSNWKRKIVMPIVNAKAPCSRLRLVNRSQIVINKQEPLLELWLASHNGGFHFAYKNERWVSNDGLDFWQALTEALAKHGEQVQLG